MRIVVGRLLILLACLVGADAAYGKTEYVFGGEEHPWTDVVSSSHLIDLSV